MIDYPHGDYLNNFVRLAAHLVQVKKFVDPFSLLQAIPSHEKMEGVLSRTSLELVNKLSPGALFPVDVIRNVVNYHLKMKEATWRASHISVRSTLLATINDVVNRTRLHSFDSLLVHQLIIQDKEKDPFVIRWKGEEAIIPIRPTKITRLVLGRLAVSLWRISVREKDTKEQVVKLWNLLTKFSRFGFIEIESIQVSVFPDEASQEPNFDVVLEFDPNHRHFSFSADLYPLFQVLSQQISREFPRDMRVASLIKKWRCEDRVNGAALCVSAEYSWKMKLAFIPEEDDDIGVSGEDTFHTVMAETLPLLIDTLHVTYDKSMTEDDVLKFLKFVGVLRQLKSLTISFARRKCFGLPVLWCALKGVALVRRIIRLIKNSLETLESLTLRFGAVGNRCLSRLFNPAGVTLLDTPLPRLVKLECSGLPCFPFIVSVVSQASNLRHLSVTCQPFEVDQDGLTWISMLLDSVHACPHLEYLQIIVQHEARHSSGVALESTPKRRKVETEKRDISTVERLLTGITRKLQSLRNMSALFQVVVVIDAEISFCHSQGDAS